MGIKTITEVGLETTTCVTCGVTYAMPAELMNYHRKHGSTHYCPNGHAQCFIEPEVPRLERELQEAKSKAESLEYQLNGALDKISRMKKRANAGLCPHCHRHFANVERHIQTKHPEELKKQ